jgi:hypothetical protein
MMESRVTMFIWLLHVGRIVLASRQSRLSGRISFFHQSKSRAQECLTILEGSLASWSTAGRSVVGPLLLVMCLSATLKAS